MGRNRVRRKKFYKSDILKMQRTAFLTVVTAYNDVRSVIGQAGAKDYSTITGGQGAQYNADDRFFRAIDFIVDVDNAVKNTLDTHSTRFFDEYIRDKNFDMSVQNEDFMKFQEALGRAFIGRGMYPLNKYFKTSRSA